MTSADPARSRPWWVSHVVASTLLIGSIALSSVIHLAPGPESVVRSIHVLGLVVGLGPVLLLDWYGLAWMAGLRRLADIWRLAEATHPLVWLGILLLAASGMFLAPDLGSPVTLTKLLLVLVVVNNGLGARALGPLLRQHPNARRLRDLPRRLRLRLLASTTTSQVAWWGATLIGLLTTLRRGAR